MTNGMREFLRTYVAELVKTDIEEGRTPISDVHEFAKEFESDFWNEILEAFENYEQLYNISKDLPTDVEAPLNEINDYLDLNISNSFEEAISDYLSDKYKCSPCGFNFEIIEDVVIVGEIDWDISSSI